jgi:hypothetical protein
MHRDLLAVLFGIVVLSAPVHAAVSAEEAAALKTTLTPMGAERPAAAMALFHHGRRLCTPFPALCPVARARSVRRRKPLRLISAKNDRAGTGLPRERGHRSFVWHQSTGSMSIRTARLRQWVYDNNLKTPSPQSWSKLVRSSTALMAIPFPIPQNGAGLIWNHIL